MQCQAEHAAQSVKGAAGATTGAAADAAGAAADSAQLQQHRATDAVQGVSLEFRCCCIRNDRAQYSSSSNSVGCGAQAADQVAHTAGGAATAVKDTVTGGN